MLVKKVELLCGNDTYDWKGLSFYMFRLLAGKILCKSQLFEASNDEAIWVADRSDDYYF